jgi:phage baseplate assembly protein W
MADVQFSRVREYKDISLSFGRNPVTHDVIALTGPDAVKRAIKTLLFTYAGEVPFFPNFGSKLHHLLFEPIDGLTTALIQSEIRDTLVGFEPRIKISALDVVPNEAENRYDVTLTFSLINLATPVTLSLFLTRLR